MNWSWLSFFVGVLVGWILEWLIDFIFWRRKHRSQQREIVVLGQQLEDAQARSRDFELQSTQCARDLDACRSELEALQAELDACRADAETSTRAGAAPISLEVEQEAQEIDPTAFSAIEAGLAEAPAPDVDAQAKAEPGPEVELGEEIDPTAFSAIEAGLAEAPAEVDVRASGAGLAAAAVGAVAAADAGEPALEKQDLTRIEGIGPKTQGLLYDAEIFNYGQLADSSVSRLQGILDAAGPRFRLLNPSTWPRQARLAAENKWDELKVLQDRLSGGRDLADAGAASGDE
jgi:predicted flap endonuclease-1-like 5' DNA nuclease